MHKVHSCPINIGADDNTNLMVAASNGDLSTLQENFKQAGARNSSGQTALMLAAGNGEEKAVRALVRMESTLKDDTGRTALMYALDYDHTRCAKILAEREAGTKNSEGETALMQAVKKNNFKLARLLARWEGGQQNDQGMTALMMAVQSNHLENTKFLLPFEKCRQDKNGWTALMMAANAGNVMRVGLLARAETNIVDKIGETALMKAARNGHNDCVRILAKREGRVRNNNGLTALMIAASKGHANCVKTLLFETGLRNNAKETALLISLKHKREACVDLLLPHEGDFPDSRGENALFWAIRNNELTYIDKLIAHLNMRRSTYGKTALMFAIELNNAYAAQKLMPYEARLRDSRGRTALMYAVEFRNLPLTILLAEKEAEIVDSFGRTALIRAMKHGYTECFQALLAREALVKDARGQTVLDLCLKWSMLGTSDFEDANDEIFSIEEEDCAQGEVLALAPTHELHNRAFKASKIKLMDDDCMFGNSAQTRHMDLSINDDMVHMAPLIGNVSFDSNGTPNSEVLSFNSEAQLDAALHSSFEALSFVPAQLPSCIIKMGTQLSSSITSDTLCISTTDSTPSMAAPTSSLAPEGPVKVSTVTKSHSTADYHSLQYALPPIIAPTRSITVSPKNEAKRPNSITKVAPHDESSVLSERHPSSPSKPERRKFKFHTAGRRRESPDDKFFPAAERSHTNTMSKVPTGGDARYIPSDSESESDIGLGIIHLESVVPSDAASPPNAPHASGCPAAQTAAIATSMANIFSASESESMACKSPANAPLDRVQHSGTRSDTLKGIDSKPISRIYSLNRISKATPDDIDSYKTQILNYLQQVKKHLVLLPRKPKDTTDKRTTLMESVMQNDVNGIQQHLDELGIMCTTDGDGSGATALMLAVMEGKIETIPYLLNELGIVNNKGYTALIYAAQDGLEDAIPHLLLELGMKSHAGRTALIQAAAFGHSHILSMLIPWEAGITTKKKQTALMRAAQNGHFRCVEILKNSPLEIKQVDGDGRTALWKAASDGHIECTALLAPIESKIAAKDGTTALIMAAERGFTRCVRLLLNWEARLTDKTHTTALMYAARAGNVGCVRALAPMEQKMRRVDGTTALIVSVRSRKPQCTQLLLAEANMRSGANETALHIAKEINSMECYQVLLEAKI